MKRKPGVLLTAIFLFAFIFSACTSPPATPSPDNTPIVIGVVETEEPEPAVESTVDFENALEDFDPANFDDPLNITNPYLPLKPGTRLIFEGATEEGGITRDHQVIITVTNLTKEIHGIQTLATWDEDYSEGQLVEAELAFYAQDNDGNVWRMGEYPEAWEEDKFIEAPAWISGLKGAKAGIMMKADPQVGMDSYSQGWGPAVGFTDRGRVDEVDQSICVPLDCYDSVLVVAEFSQEEPDAFQLKYYAPGLGNIRVHWRGLDATRETLELVEFVELSAEELAAAHESALELEARAYEISKEVYDQTPPLEEIK